MGLSLLWATMLLFYFVTVCFLNYLDRGAVSGVLPTIQKEFGLTDSENGFIGSAFTVGYTFASPVFAVLSDKVNGFVLMGVGLSIWIVAVIGCAFTFDFWSLIVARIFVGVGEASFMCLAPPYIDLIAPPSMKAQWLALYFMTIPFGMAFGYFFGPSVQELSGRYSWRGAFIAEAALMVPFTILAFVIPCFWKGKPSQEQEMELDEGEKPNAVFLLFKQAFQLFTNINYMLCCLGYAALTGVIGTYSIHGPTYIVRTFYDNDRDKLKIASSGFGGVTAICGFFGTIIGGLALDCIGGGSSKAMLICWTTAIGALPFIVTAFFMENLYAFYGCLLVGEFLIFLSTGPVNSAIMWTVTPNLKPMACALSVMIIHLIGDTPMPPIAGAISQEFTMRWAMAFISFMLIPAAGFWAVGWCTSAKSGDPGLRKERLSDADRYAPLQDTYDHFEEDRGVRCRIGGMQLELIQQQIPIRGSMATDLRAKGLGSSMTPETEFFAKGLNTPVTPVVDYHAQGLGKKVERHIVGGDTNKDE